MADKDVEFLYGLAYNFYTHGRYSEAARLFSVLALCDSRQQRFWLGLGACRQKLGRYNEALSAYGQAFKPEDDDYRPALHIAECLFELHWYNATCAILDIARRKVNSRDNRRLVEERIVALRHQAEQALRNAETKQPTSQSQATQPRANAEGAVPCQPT